jgi:hypothetical protein
MSENERNLWLSSLACGDEVEFRLNGHLVRIAKITRIDKSPEALWTYYLTWGTKFGPNGKGSQFHRGHSMEPLQSKPVGGPILTAVVGIARALIDAGQACAQEDE